MDSYNEINCAICGTRMNPNRSNRGYYCPKYDNEPYYGLNNNYYHNLNISSNQETISLSFKINPITQVIIYYDLKKIKTELSVFELEEGHTTKILFLDLPKILTPDFPELKSLTNQLIKYLNLSVFS